MTYPTLGQTPHKLAAAAHYKIEDSDAGLKIPKNFTMKDQYGDEFVMYKTDLVTNTYMVPRNCAPHVKDNYKTYYNVASGKKYQWDDGFVPRDDCQLEMVESSAALFALGGHYGGHIMQAPTGYGKTYLGSSVIQRVGERALVITTKEDILDDWKQALSKTLNIDPSKIGEWRGDVVPTPEHEVVVGLVQSICKGYDRYPKELYESFGMVVVDEVQRMGAEKFNEAMWYLPARYRLGLSATPFRKDGRDTLFHAHIGQVMVDTEEQTLVPKVICVDTEWQVPEVWDWKTRKLRPLEIAWDRAIIAVKHLQEDVNRNQIICNFMRTALKRGRNTVILSDTTDHLQFIKDALVDSGVADDEEMFGWYCGLQSGVYVKASEGLGTAKEQRERAKKARICLATYKMCGEGTNVPWWDTAILATSKSDVAQPVGRIRREWDDKQQPVVLDLCDYNHRVFSTFAKKRCEWYQSIGAEIVHK